ncbi:MAG: hypothetical protein BWY02_02970 [bacterium ADurb.Bin157]|nr:MAG: hypothetical protein BWY02_02970 [bacterium ADurb.Bin157]
MIKHTEGEWVAFNPDIKDKGVDKKYFYVHAAGGFYNPQTGDGFGLVGFMQRGDAVLLANAKKMYDILVKFTSVKNERELDELTQTASAMLEEMEAQANEES